MHKLGFIGGVGTHGLFQGAILDVDTLYGRVKILLTRTDPRIVCVPRYGLRESIPPSEVNWRAIIDALLHHGVKHVVSTTIATRLKDEYEIGDIVIPHDIIDLTTVRQKGFKPSQIVFTDMRNVFSEELRKLVIEKAREQGFKVHDKGVVVVIDGPRFETPAEAKMYRMLGGDLLSMSLAPEAFMAREAGLEYATIAIVMNEPADKAPKINREELLEKLNTIKNDIRELILSIAREISSK